MHLFSYKYMLCHPEDGDKLPAENTMEIALHCRSTVTLAMEKCAKFTLSGKAAYRFVELRLRLAGLPRRLAAIWIAKAVEVVVLIVPRLNAHNRSHLIVKTCPWLYRESSLHSELAMD